MLGLNQLPPHIPQEIKWQAFRVRLRPTINSQISDIADVSRIMWELVIDEADDEDMLR